MDFRPYFVDVTEAARRLGKDRDELILLCKRNNVEMRKLWGSQVPIISQILWNEKFENMWTKILTGREGDLPVPGDRCAVKDAAARMGKSSTDFVSWCRKHHVRLGLNIDELQGYVPYILWTPQMQRDYELSVR